MNVQVGNCLLSGGCGGGISLFWPNRTNAVLSSKEDFSSPEVYDFLSDSNKRKVLTKV